MSTFVSPIVETDGVTQTLKCRNCGTLWTRTASQGRAPVHCDDCRLLAPARQSPKAPRVREFTPTKGGHHKAFDTLRQVADARVPVMLVGPAGSGKSTAGRQLAAVMDLTFSTESCSPQMTKWDVLGFVGPNGNYVAGVLRDAFENGGVVLLDEIDASNPAVLVSINLIASVMVGETVTFPDGVDVPRHPDFILIAGANTYGDGASSQYVGRSQLDAATLDRFAMIDWSYDERMEFHAAGADVTEWVTHVQAVRKAAVAANVPLLVTPRASINGGMLLRNGMKRETVESLVLYKGLTRDQVRSIKSFM